MWIKTSLDFGSFEFNSDINLYFKRHHQFHKTAISFTEREQKARKIKTESFISDQYKFLIRYADGYYHETIDFFGYFINALEICKELNIKDPLFIFASAPSEGTQMRIFFDKWLKDLKINNYIILNRTQNMIEANNCFNLISYSAPAVPSPLPTLYNSFKNLYVKEKDKIPFKKVYLSRRKVWRNIEENDLYQKGLKIDLNSKKSRPKTEIRIFEEEKLENFLSNYNFEILHPEEFFDKDYISQINYFYEVKTLMSVTSSGLVNQMLMQSNTNIIEISTPLMFIENKKEIKDEIINEHLQYFYKDFAYLKDQFYCAIANEDLQADTVINKIKNNKYLMDIIND